jgi:predicted enzyme related to lactoylglutathione lyase
MWERAGPRSRRTEEGIMGAPVVHFEIIGQDGDALRAYYGELFGWSFDANNPMGYGVVAREDNRNAEGIGIGGGVAGGPPGYGGHVTFYAEVPDVEACLATAEKLGGKRVMGPETPMEGLVIGLFTDPEGHTIGVIQSAA